MKKHLLLILLFLNSSVLAAQQKVIVTMEDAIMLAQTRSTISMAAKNTILADYWAYRSHRASLLPSLNLSANLGALNRSQKQLQDAVTGEIYYSNNYNMNNNAEVFIKQIIAATGGTLSLSSYLNRLDQYRPSRVTTYYSQPVTLSYLQPIWTFNSHKWNKKIEPLKYEQAKKEYLETMESITITAVTYFYNLLLAQMNLDLAKSSYENTRAMYDIAVQRFDLGSIKRNEVLQLEYRLLNDSLALNTNENSYLQRKSQLMSLLGFNDQTDIEVRQVSVLPDMVLDYSFVLAKALENSSFTVRQDINAIEADRDVAQAKGNRGVQASISTQFGLSNSANEFSGAYSHLMDREVIGLQLSVPVMDWGMSKGRVKMAEARRKTAINRIEQAFTDFRQDISTKVMQFNSQRSQCSLAERANRIAEERYEISMNNFLNSSLSVTELNTAQTDKQEANAKYVQQLFDYWIYYFTIRKLTLYDYVSQTDISAEYDNIINE